VKNIIQRILSGIVYIALIVAAIVLLDNSPVLYLLVFSLITVLGISEVLQMAKSEAATSWLVTVVDLLGGIGVFISLWLRYNTTSDSHSVWLLPITVYVVLRGIVQLYKPQQNALRSLERSYFALAYVALPIGLLNAIIHASAPRVLLGVFIFIWVNDTGAYCAGRLLGRHHLFERISPKKTWEGFIGGLLFCIASAYVTYYWFNEFFQVPDLNTWILLSVVVSVFATFGDLIESLIKRTVHVKDSGHLIPGHGGILDRIDSLLLVSPAVLIFLILLQYNT